ncbi:hypothetical protein GCM10007320_27480 [Pseudorhodoferax aquiterrae]|uniref:Uncharacterized protein n=1 Tax=Pseudorhodoferax aquiterrae TaxID=747304 RepID=A0ABQ3G1R3_9BURK|nr:hypothetical protein GCM10007320_27480 [Pseudorhodoferax aquiterrae]
MPPATTGQTAPSGKSSGAPTSVQVAGWRTVVVLMSNVHGADAPPAVHAAGSQANGPKAAEQAMRADAAERALPGRWRRPLEGGWNFYTQ